MGSKDYQVNGISAFSGIGGHPPEISKSTQVKTKNIDITGLVCKLDQSSENLDF